MTADERQKLYEELSYILDMLDKGDINYATMTLEDLIEKIKNELKERADYFVKSNKLVEAQRIEQRTRFDIEMLNEIGFCKGIENYSRHLSGRNPGDPPPTLIEYLPKDALMIIDESHVTVPQIGGMYILCIFN